MNHFSPSCTSKKRLRSLGARSPSASGFALVIALGLMAFILLLLIGLTSFVQVETRREATELDIERARQNALLGLRVALGQLQKEAGPDQRVTARADVRAGTEEVNPLTVYWTGVWDAAPDAPSPALSNATWLVSGDNPMTELGGDLIQVLGEGSASAETLPTPAGQGRPGLYVPSVPIEETISSGTAKTIGHYAYWIGDEGVKAKVNLVNPYQTNNPNVTSPEYRHALLSHRRNAPEQITDLDFLAVTEQEELKYRDKLLTQLLSTTQLEIIGDELEMSSNDAIRRHYFDITATSEGLPINVRDGGLKIDLTRALENGETKLRYIDGEEAPDDRIFEDGPSWSFLLDYYNNIRVNSDNPEIEPHFREGGVAIPRPQRSGASNPWENQWPTKHGISPIIVASQLGMGLVHPTALYQADPANPGTGIPESAIFTVAPIVVLANPYNVRLSGANYVIRYYSYNSSGAQLNPQVRIELDGVTLQHTYPDGTPSTGLVHINQLLPEYDAQWVPEPDQGVGEGNWKAGNWRRNDLRFLIDNSEGLEPGEIKIFALPAISEYKVGSKDTEPPKLKAMDEGYADHYAWIAPLNDPGDSQLASQLRLTSEQTHNPSEHPTTISMGGQSRYTAIYFYKLNEGQKAPFDLSSISGQIIQQIRPYARTFDSRDTKTLSDQTDQLIWMHTFLKNTQWSDTFHRNAAVNAIAHFNLRAHDHRTFFTAGNTHYQAPPLYATRIEQTSSAFHADNLWESGIAPILFHIPRNNEYYQSIAELQHVDFSLNSFAPSLQVGNSFAHPFINPENKIQSLTVDELVVEWLDLSYYLNEALWDPYFFSTVISTDITSDGDLTINDRIKVSQQAGDPAQISADLNDHSKAAMHLTIDGAFNVNSTSVEAWKAVLFGSNNLDTPYQDFSSSLTGQSRTEDGREGWAPILRHPYPTGPDGDFWKGFRRLESPEVERLASAIVEEVKKRGPFLSLAQFVNRTLTNDDTELAVRGPLQAAIDYSAINPEGTEGQRFDEEPPTGLDYNFQEAVFFEDDDSIGFRGRGAPGFLTQADILTAIGSFITARSDTFLIRAYGNVTHPLAGDDTPLAQAWCEAIVQRRAEYVDSSQPADTPTVELTGANEKLGRKFEIISFRWLSEDEI